MSIIKKLIDPLSYTYQLVVRFQTALVSVSRVFEIIEIQPEKTDYEGKCVEKEGNLLISFENVSFAYEDENVLHNVSFRVKPNERIAFVGESGSGKSTILKLISRQFATDKIALVSQETTLFPLSVADNVRVGNPQASHDDIVRALGMAGCETFIKQLPEGIETVLTENGGNLSGGQRQRISIARAIVKDAELLLFDESTSALDYQTEINICKTIDEISKDRTVITVAHRLNTIRDYDRIYVLDRGEIVEQGTHSELMSMHGRYAHMYDEFINKEMRDRV
jgi:ABC-type multidrug transport system fused ATPase/permease subunit